MSEQELDDYFPYQAYERSSIKWLGDIPEHWFTTKIKFSTYVKGRIGWQNLRADEFVDEGPYCVTGTDFVKGQIDWSRCYHVSQERYEQDGYIQLKTGDLLITKDGSIGKLALIDDLPGLACLNSGLFVARPTTDLYVTSYLYWVLDSAVFQEFIDYMSAGTTIQHLYQYVFENFEFPIPPLYEQQAIGRFLDRKTSEIDKLIAAKQRLIDLLQEKRAALITQAVTKGLDPTAPMKDSGIEWLGQIPASWSTPRIKHICDVKGRIGFRGYATTDQVAENSGALVLGATQIDPNGFIDLTNPVYLSWEKYYESPEIMIDRDDIIVVQRGSTCGKVGIVNEDLGETTINPSLVVLKNISISNPFLFYFLRSRLVQEFLNGLLATTAIPMLSQEQIGNIIIVIPQDTEMSEIVAYLDKETTQISRVINLVVEQITLLREYRNALISATVTGKIDVRKHT